MILTILGAFAAGAQLTLEQIMELIPADKREAIAANSLVSISQGEHPVFGFMFYHIHPCQTAAVMKDLKYDKYIIRYVKILFLLLF
ncbi:unnamed protein product [Gongylonema pulchrum]|uniref:Ubiquitin-like-conjugating enzyme ATG10 n=1 Tax=Gongylonema pulchrum TaxID=637853 RepID=A0A183F1C5_9BILA|nr:unnamed protein product [Gongylonema pulchrum]